MKQQKGRNAMKEFREWQESIRSVSVENKTDTALAPDTVDLLLDVEGVNSLADVVNEEDGKQGSHDVVATKVKSLSSYVSSSGDRKTYEELLVGSSMKPAVTLSRDALSFDIVSSDDDSSSSCVYS
jgi:hypothetical protein